jgi:hypothetical protein
MKYSKTFVIGALLLCFSIAGCGHEQNGTQAPGGGVHDQAVTPSTPRPATPAQCKDSVQGLLRQIADQPLEGRHLLLAAMKLGVLSGASSMQDLADCCASDANRRNSLCAVQ